MRDNTKATLITVFISSIIVLLIVVSGLLIKTAIHERDQFKSKCRDRGGVPLFGRHIQACVKPDSMIDIQ